MREKPPAAGWGQDPVTSFIQRAEDNISAVFLEFRQEFDHLIELGLLMDTAIRALKSEDSGSHPVFKTLLARSYGCYLGGIRLSAGGQFTEACALYRACIECGLYAFYIARNPNLGQLWLNRNVDEQSRKAVKRNFKPKEMIDYLEREQPIIGGQVQKYYENTITFGAHPNVMSVGLNLEVIGDWDKAEYLLLNTDDIPKTLVLNARAGLLVLSIYGLIYTKQFNENGIFEKISALFEYHNTLASR